MLFYHVIGFQTCLKLRSKHTYGEVVRIANLVFLLSCRTFLRITQRDILLVRAVVGEEDVEVVFISLTCIHFGYERTHVAAFYAFSDAVENHSPYSVFIACSLASARLRP